MKNSIVKERKSRYWSFLLYPDSAPDNWKQILEQSYLPISVSPLHQFDVDETTGESKKPHYHVIVCFKGPTTESNFNNMFPVPLGQPFGRSIASVVGAYRYFWHLDNPDKFQYDQGGNLDLNGFSIYDFKEFSNSEKNQLFDSVENIIFDQKFTELVSLIRYLKQYSLSDELYLVRRNTLYVNALIRSNKYNEEAELKEKEAALVKAYKEYCSYGVLNDESIKNVLDLFSSIKIIDD